jgi:hypothetical protein
MPILIPGTDDFHTMATLTDAINIRPFVPGLISSLDWAEQGIYGRDLAIDRRYDGVDMVDENPRGTPGSQVVIDDADPILLRVPHYGHDFVVRPEEVRGRRAFGQETVYEMPQDYQDRLLDRWRRDMDYTTEILRVGTVFGKVRKRDGAVRRDLTTVFGERPWVFGFPFADQSKNFYRFLSAAKRVAEDGIGEMSLTGWRGFAARDMFNKAVYQKSVQDAYRFWDTSSVLRADNTKAPFNIITDATLEYYRNSTIPNSGGRKVFPEDAIVFVGTAPGQLQVRNSPREDMRITNQEVGVPMYLSPEDLKHGKGVEVEGEMNTLAYVRRYKAVIIIVDTSAPNAAATIAAYTNGQGLDTFEF